MSYELSFGPEFFYAEHDDHFGGETERPTTVYAAIRSLAKFHPEYWQRMVADVFPTVPADRVDADMVMEQIRKTNACHNLQSPIEVYIDEEGWHSVTVYDEPKAPIAEETLKAKIGPITSHQAFAILGADKHRQGGGWGKIDGTAVYLCTGVHKDGTNGWKIMQIGERW